MSRIVLGTTVDNGKPAHLDVDVLLRTRLLVQASSGAGKSWLLRVLCERLYGTVPVIVIDPEGEFATLREKYGYVLAGKGGDTPADPRSAAMLATRLLELRASAVCDIFELKPADRHLWVKLFLDSMVDAPKKLWQPVVVIVDEAQLFVPEKGAGESDAADSMISLATRGRKRGYCAVFATQRLGKLRKDAAAELQNVLVGGTFIDVDRKRAAETLGIADKRDLAAFNAEIKVLPPGQFFALGRAIALERTLIKTADVQTSHPKPGSSKHAAAPPAPPEKVRALLPSLADLPAEAETKARTESELRKELTAVRRELAEARRAQPAAPKAETKTVEKHVLKDGQLRRAEGLVSAIANEVTRHEAAVKDRLDLLRELTQEIAGAIRQTHTQPTQTERVVRPSPHARGVTPRPSVTRERPARVVPPGNADVAIGKGETIILTAAAQHPDGVSREQLTVLTGYKRSSRDTYLQRLQAAGLVEQNGGGMIVATDAGIAALGSNFEPLPTGADLAKYWLERLGGGEQTILRTLLQNGGDWMERDAITDATQYKRSSRDTYLQRLQARRLIVTERGAVRASDQLFG